MRFYLKLLAFNLIWALRKWPGNVTRHFHFSFAFHIFIYIFIHIWHPSCRYVALCKWTCQLFQTRSSFHVTDLNQPTKMSSRSSFPIVKQPSMNLWINVSMNKSLNWILSTQKKMVVFVNFIDQLLASVSTGVPPI